MQQKKNSYNPKLVNKLHLKLKYFLLTLQKPKLYYITLLQLQNNIIYDKIFFFSSDLYFYYFYKKKLYNKNYKKIYFSEKLQEKYLVLIQQQIHLYKISKFQNWLKIFYKSFSMQSDNLLIFETLKNNSLFIKHRLSFLTQFINYKQDEFFLIKDIYIQKFILKKLIYNQLKKKTLKKHKLILGKDLYTNSKIGLRFCNMFMRQGKYSKIFKVFLKLNIYFKTIYGFELIYLLILLLYLYKVPYSNKLKKKSGRTLTIPTHTTVDRFFFKFFNLFTKAIKKRTELSIFLRLSSEIESLTLTNKISFFFKDFSDLIDLTLSGRTNLLKKKRKIKIKKQQKLRKKKKRIIKIKKYRRRKRRGLKSRVYQYKIKRYIHLLCSGKKEKKKIKY